MGNRADRRKKKKQQPRYEKRFTLAAHEVFGFGRERCRRLLYAADEKVATSLASDEAVEDVFRQLGVTINFYDPQRITETLEG